jgi:CheY-like chemotaxis protein
MDIVMPVMDGVEATKRLRADGVIVPIIAVTANSMLHEREQYRNAGMNGFLSKPYNQKEVLDTIRSMTTSVMTRET